MSIFQILKALNKIYPSGFSFRMREDGDIYIYVHSGDNWILKDAFDTLAEFVEFVKSQPTHKEKRTE